jgi:competence ComEA-like helix-hairpin-helix protein
MPTKDDRRAALVLLALALAGLAVRFVTDRTTAPGAVAYRAAPGARPSRDSVGSQAARLGRPLVAGETVDVDRATAEELVRLPRVGPALAARIVAERDAHGPFGGLDGLGRVSGIGESTRESLRPWVTFSGRAVGRSRPAGPEAGGERVQVNRASAEELERLPGVGPQLARAIVEDRARRGPFRSLEDLSRVRGIGPALLERLKGRILVP